MYPMTVSRPFLRIVRFAAAASLLLATAALADPPPANVTPATGTNGTTGKAGTVWGGAGFYHTSISFDLGNGYSASSSSTDFGLNAGAGYALRYSDAISIMPFGNIGLVFPGGGEFLPVTVGGGVRFNQVGPVKILAGLGLTLMPELGYGNGNSQTPVGLGLIGQVFYPLPSVQGLGLEGQLMVHILSDSTTMFTINGGVTFDLF